MNSAIEAPPKRYRFTGMERDEESGLAYHGARYLSPLLARWIAIDPAPRDPAASLYGYASGNPLANVDPDGRQDQRFDKMTPEQRAKMHVPRVYMDEIREEVTDPEPAVPEWKTRPYVEPTEVRLVKYGVMLLIGGILAVPTGGTSLIGAFAAGGGLSAGIAVTMSGVSLGIAKDVSTVSEKDERNLEMGARLSVGFTNPVSMIATPVAALSTGGDLEQTLKISEAANDVWYAGEGLYSLGNIARQETKFQFGYMDRTKTGNFAWNKTLKEEVRSAMLGQPNAPFRANPLFYRGREYMDLSHFVPQRFIEAFELERLLNRPFNLTPRWATEHAMVDPGRFYWMSDAFKDVYGSSRSLPYRLLGDAPPWLVGTANSYYSLKVHNSLLLGDAPPPAVDEQNR